MQAPDGGSQAFGAVEVAEVRSLLRRPDSAARRTALALIDAWGPMPQDPDLGRTLLRAATASYPWVSGDRTDPGEVLAELLWQQPELIPVAEIEGAYLIASDRVRRALLHLLARRTDDGGIGSLVHLLGPEGPTDLLPLPTPWLLDPVLAHPDACRLAPTLAAVAPRRGWTPHAADLLKRLVLSGRLDAAQQHEVSARVAPFLEQLVEVCDRSQLRSGRRPARLDTRSSNGGDPSGASVHSEARSGLMNPSGAERVRADRRRAFALLDLIEVLDAAPGASVQQVLHRALASADPRVAARAATALVARGVELAPERIPLLARDPLARADLWPRLEALGRLDLLGEARSAPRCGVSRAEAELVSWLASEVELGRPPDEMEHACSLDPAGLAPDSFSETEPETADHLTADATAGNGEQERADAAAGLRLHLFRFRMRAPHWSSSRGWLIGIAGPYSDDGTVPAGVSPVVGSLYQAEDEDSPIGHARSLIDSHALWPEDPDAVDPGGS